MNNKWKDISYLFNYFQFAQKMSQIKTSTSLLILKKMKKKYDKNYSTKKLYESSCYSNMQFYNITFHYKAGLNNYFIQLLLNLIITNLII